MTDPVAPLKLDERTEGLIWRAQVDFAYGDAKQCKAAEAALRTRIRELVEEARNALLEPNLPDYPPKNR